jgi:hypothetical protein
MIDLTESYPMSFDAERLRAELQHMEDKVWVRHYDATQPAGWTTLVLRSINGLLSGPDSIRHGPWEDYKNTSLVDDCPYMREVIESFKCPIGRVRLSKMGPHVRINAHRDIEEEVASVAFRQVRLHIPITTSDKVVFFVGNETFRMAIAVSKCNCTPNCGSCIASPARRASLSSRQTSDSSSGRNWSSGKLKITSRGRATSTNSTTLSA